MLVESSGPAPQDSRSRHSPDPNFQSRVAASSLPVSKIQISVLLFGTSTSEQDMSARIVTRLRWTTYFKDIQSNVYVEFGACAEAERVCLLQGFCPGQAVSKDRDVIVSGPVLEWRKW